MLSRILFLSFQFRETLRHYNPVTQYYLSIGHENAFQSIATSYDCGQGRFNYCSTRFRSQQRLFLNLNERADGNWCFSLVPELCQYGRVDIPEGTLLKGWTIRVTPLRDQVRLNDNLLVLFLILASLHRVYLTGRVMITVVKRARVTPLQPGHYPLTSTFTTRKEESDTLTTFQVTPLIFLPKAFSLLTVFFYCGSKAKESNSKWSFSYQSPFQNVRRKD